ISGCWQTFASSNFTIHHKMLWLSYNIKLENEVLLPTQSGREPENNYTLAEGYFDLRFEFCPLGDIITLYYHASGKTDITDFLEIYDFYRDQVAKTADHILIDGNRITLKLSDEFLRKYFQLASEYTEAHLNEDCEPPGYGLSLKIYEDACHIFAEDHLLKTRPNR
ncbi:MAG: hypothetical protein J7K75_05375, partial [Desulfuromonas sp.]|nr:hypothetical protein [Desulfuromonas sp.]